MGNYVAVNSQKKKPVCSGCLVPAMLDRDELAIHKEVVAPKGKINLEAMKFLNQKERALMLAASGTSSEKIKEMLKSGAPADTYDENRTSPLHVACRQGSLEVIQELIDHRAALDITDCAGWTALHIASYSCRTDVVSLLLRNSADATIVNRTGETPWDLASDSSTQGEFIKYWELKSGDSESPRSQTPSRSNARQVSNANMDCKSKFLYDINAKKAFPRPIPNLQAKGDSGEKSKKRSVKVWQTIGNYRSGILKAGEELREVFIVVFQNNPHVGLCLIVMLGIVPQVPLKIAQFLYEWNVDACALGLILSDSQDFYYQISKEFIQLLPLNKTNLVFSLKTFMKKVQIPSDSSKTAQLMKCFSEVFWSEASHFKSPGSVESLSLSILMLDFSLHDPTSSPMSKSDFTTSTSGMHDGEDFSKKYLSWVFQEVKKQSIRGRLSTPTSKPFPKSHHSGHLASRCSGDWKERYFILKHSILFTFPSNSSLFPQSLIQVKNLSVHFDTRLQLFTISSSVPFNQLKFTNEGSVRVRPISRVYFKAGNLKLWLEGFQGSEDVKVTIV
jgi:hypothetical protein